MLTQLMTEKKEKAITARAASAGIPSVFSVCDHWLAKKQKHTNHKNVQTPGEKKGKAENSST